MNKLTALANKYTSDKGTEYYEKHGYTEVYGDYIPSRGKYNLLEIGIWHGDSLRMWNEYNPELKIDGIDIDNNVFNYIKESENISIHIGDQANPEFLKSVTENKSYHFIIDDGSHRHEDIVASFKYLYPSLKVGEHYFIEDLHAQQAQRENTINSILLHLEELKEKYTYDLVCNDKLLIIKKWLFQ